MDKIFYQNQDDKTGRFVVVDEDENSIWAYLTLPSGEQIVKDCFLGSRVKIEIEKIDPVEFKLKQIPPPMIKEFSTDESCLVNLGEEDISVSWGLNGNVLVRIYGNPFLFFIGNEEKGFCKSISKNGIYGNQWDERQYREIFE